MKSEIPLTIDRLGKRDLGRHAFEKQMANRITKLISNESNDNAHPSIIQKLDNLLNKDPNVETALLCSRHAIQIHKMKGEGGHFCGYRNMQMLCLALGFCGYQASDGIDLRQKLSVPRLQDLIERAWDRGFNDHGRILTGGVKGTRKHVGTSEVEALLLSLNIPCTGTAFEGEDTWSRLLEFIENYFSTSLSESRSNGKVEITSRPPIFLQRHKHSVTVVGIVKLKSGKRRILIFDPAWKPPATSLEGKPEAVKMTWEEVLALRRYSKSERWLKRFKAFETLTVETSK